MRYQRLILVAILLVLSLPPTKIFAIAAWPDTGQDKCYNNFAQITCPQPGQAFYGQDAQHQGIQPSYTKLDENGNALPDSATVWSMVRDNVTGLIWEVKTNDDDIHNRDDTYTWCDSTLESPGYCTGTNDTETFIATLNSEQFGGFNDWRLPTVQELATLLKSNVSNPAIDTNFFPNTLQSGSYPIYTGYWSSTIVAGSSSQAWEVEFDDGGIIKQSCREDSFCKNLVRAVRGVSIGSAQQLKNNNDGTVTDLNTGLMWRQTAESSKMDWEEALSYIVSLNQQSFAGYADWRLPNRNELQSIVAYNTAYPAINTNFFQNVDSVDSYTWSSTTEYGINENAWFVYFDTGVANCWNKQNHASVFPVRAGNIAKFTLNVSLTGNGTGTVNSSPSGISCGSDCSEAYGSGMTVTLTTISEAGSIFTGWSGDCLGTGSCVLTINSHKSVIATFVNPSIVPTLVPIYYLLQKK